jgi:polyferredoxin
MQVSGIISLGIGLAVGFTAVKLYLVKRYISIPFALLTVTFMISGLPLFTAVILVTVGPPFWGSVTAFNHLQVTVFNLGVPLKRARAVDLLRGNRYG